MSAASYKIVLRTNIWRITMRKLLPILLFITSTAHATTYYVANNGNDANNGLSPTTAWQTIAKVNSVSLANNDVVLFKRGQVFRGGVASRGFPLGIRFDAYGTGVNPVIAGSVKITNWKPSSLGANIYEANVSQFITANTSGVENTIENLFVNGKLMTIARYPNVASPDKTNWLKVGATAGTDAFTDPKLAALNKPVDYWKGATLRIRTYSWYYKVFPITGSSNGKLIAAGLGSQLPEWGYFIDGKLSELDYPGEWYYDAKTKKVYLYPAQAVDPNTLLVEGSTYKTGLSIFWHEDNSVVKNLTFRHFINAGVEVNSSNNVKVQNCKFEYNLTGITTWNPANLLVSNNAFDQQLSTGILLNAATGFDVAQSVVEKNTMTNTGMMPLYCQRYSGICYGIGMAVFGKAFTLRENVLENTGWTSIYLKADGSHLVEHNVIRNALSLLNDGGAISIGSNDNIIRGNFLLNSVGNVDKSNGCANTAVPCYHHTSYGMGVGADSNYKNIVVENNTIAGNNDWAVRFNAFTNSKILNNVLFNNESQILLEDTSGVSLNNTVSGNTLYSATLDQIAVKMTKTTEHGQLDNNYYCNPYSDILFMRDDKRYSLGHWKTAFNQDQLSKQCNFVFSEYVTKVSGVEMFSNTTFDSNITGWWGGVYDPLVAGMTGGSLKYTNKAAVTGFVNYVNLPLQTGQFYRLRFQLKGSAFGNVELQITDTTDYANLASRFFSYSPQAKNYEFVFKASRTTAKGQAIFISRAYDAPFYWLDNVSLVPVTAQVAVKPAQLFMNSTAQMQTQPLIGNYVDLTGQAAGTSINLAPFSSRILIKQ
jgi:hypothetical protein